MQVSKQDLEGCTQSISFKYDADQMDQRFNKELSSLKSKVKVPGFRKGKVPSKILHNRYGANILNDLQSDAIQESWRHLINDLEMVPFSQPDLDVTQPLRRGKGLEFTFSFEVIPPFELPEASSLEGEKVTWTVNTARIDKEIETLCDMHGEWITLKRRKKCRAADLVTIALKGFEGDEEVASLNSPEEKFELGQQRIIPELETAITGLKIDETFSVSYTFPEDHPNPDLVGKDIRFEGTLSDIQEKSALTIEQLIEKLPDEDEAALRDRLSTELKSLKETESQQALRSSIAKQLREQSEFILPPTAVAEQTHARLHNHHQHGAGEDCEHDHSAEEESEAQKEAEADLRLEAIIRTYAKQNEITVNDSDFTGRLLELLRSAGEYGMQMIQFYQQPANRDRLKASILDDKVIDAYIAGAQLKEVEKELGVEEE